MRGSWQLEPGAEQEAGVSEHQSQRSFLPFNCCDPLHRPSGDADVKIVAVDLQLMAPLPGVTQIHGDITKVGLWIAFLLAQLGCICRC